MRWFRRKKDDDARPKTDKWYFNELGMDDRKKLLYIHDEVVESLLNNCMPYGIRSIQMESHYGNVLFNNDIEFRYWDANRYYAWMSHGHFKDMQDKEKILYTWNEAMPSVKSLWIMKKMIAHWYGDLVIRRDSTVIYHALEQFAPKDIEEYKKHIET